MQQQKKAILTHDGRKGEEASRRGRSAAPADLPRSRAAAQHGPLEMAPVEPIDWSHYVRSRMRAFGESW